MDKTTGSPSAAGRDAMQRQYLRNNKALRQAKNMIYGPASSSNEHNFLGSPAQAQHTPRNASPGSGIASTQKREASPGQQIKVSPKLTGGSPHGGWTASPAEVQALHVAAFEAGPSDGMSTAGQKATRVRQSNVPSMGFRSSGRNSLGHQGGSPTGAVAAGN